MDATDASTSAPLPRPHARPRRSRARPLVPAAVVVLLLAAARVTAGPASAQGPEPTPDPYLRLATPVIPANPSESELGSLLYWYHCMPCHGDQGQGLTDEWREVWVEDHQNCWARGCHTGRPGDEGFPIPRAVPAVIGSPAALVGFAGVSDLAAYLHAAHPPQRPGALTPEECRAIAVFLLDANERGQSPPDNGLSPDGWAGVALGACALALGGLWLSARPGGAPRPGQG